MCPAATLGPICLPGVSKGGIRVKLSCITKYAPVIGVIVILACAAIHVIHTVKEHRTMLTALPLWIRVSFVLVFWGLVLLVGAVCYILTQKHLKK